MNKEEDDSPNGKSLFSRRIVFIVGMHRSGTSALARTLGLAGASLPKTLMPPQPDNPEGFWEPLPVVTLDDELLTRMNSSWEDPSPLDEPRRQRLLRDPLWIQEAARRLLGEFPNANVAVVKDPRISRLLPLWASAADRAGFEPVILICCRSPLEVADSLAARNKMAFQQAQLLWLAYMLEAERDSRGFPRAFVHYDELLSDWRRALGEALLANDLGGLNYDEEVGNEIDRYLSKTKQHHVYTMEQVLRDKRVSPLLKDAWTMLVARPMPEDAIFDKLRGRFGDAWTILNVTGAVPVCENNAAASDSVVGLASAQPGGRKVVSHEHRRVIVHYHLFKNAGTSLDRILKENFKDGWCEHEGPGTGWHSSSVAEYLIDNPKTVVLSSHTALLPPPDLPGAAVFPVIFLRHPIDRIRSIYEFERQQVADTEGARMAKRTDMAGYIRWRLSRKGDRSIRNFQSYRLAFAVSEVQVGWRLSEEERALEALQILPFVGVVEEFDFSLARLQRFLSPAFPFIDFEPTRANVTQAAGSSLADRLENLCSDVGEDVYGEIVNANSADIKIYQIAMDNIKKTREYSSV